MSSENMTECWPDGISFFTFFTIGPKKDQIEERSKKEGHMEEWINGSSVECLTTAWE